MTRFRLFVFVFLSVSAVAFAHPGQLAKDGCHRCKKNCAPHGADGTRHCHAAPSFAKTPAVEIVRVERVVDGDTIRVRFSDGSQEPIRIIGIDCPETRKQCDDEACDRSRALAEQSTNFLKSKLSQQPVALVSWKEDFDRDRYRRVLAYVHRLSGEDVGQSLVESGLCADVSAQFPHPRRYRGVSDFFGSE